MRRFLVPAGILSLAFGALGLAMAQEAKPDAASLKSTAGSRTTAAGRAGVQTIPAADPKALAVWNTVNRSPSWADVQQRFETARKMRGQWDNGYAGLEEIYGMMKSPSSTGTKSLEEHLAELAKWREAIPGSAEARIVSAGVLTSYAWEARGSGVAATVTEEGWRVFHERIAEAHRLLDQALLIGVKDGEAYARLLNLAFAEGVPREVANRWLADGMRLDPTYFSMYENMAVYLMPRWGGSPGEIEEFAAGLIDKLPGDDGLEAYAHVVFRIHNYEGGVGDTLYWGEYERETLVKAAEVMLRRNPKSPAAAQFAALCSVVGQDHAAAQRIRPFVGPYNQDDKIWFWQSGHRQFLQWSAAVESPRSEENWVFAGPGGCPGIAFANEESRVWVAQQYGRAAAHLMNVRTGRIELSLPSPGGVVNGFLYDPARQWVVYSAWKGPFTGWALFDLSGLREPVLHATKNQCAQLALHPQKPIVYWTESDALNAWNVETDSAGPEMPTGSHRVICVSPQGSFLATNQMVIDTTSGAVKARLGLVNGRPVPRFQPEWTLAVDDEGCAWAVGNLSDGPLRQRGIARYSGDGESAEMLLECPRGTRVWLSPDQKLAAIAKEIVNGARLTPIEVRNVATGERVQQFAGHWNSIGTIVFSPNGRKLASMALLADAVKTWSLDGAAE